MHHGGFSVVIKLGVFLSVYVRQTILQIKSIYFYVFEHFRNRLVNLSTLYCGLLLLPPARSDGRTKPEDCCGPLPIRGNAEY
jgi:hypothetical protein